MTALAGIVRAAGRIEIGIERTEKCGGSRLDLG